MAALLCSLACVQSSLGYCGLWEGRLSVPNPYQDRQAVYKKIEKNRGSRVIAYVTGDRAGMQTQISNEAVDLFGEHLDAVFPTKKISLILHTMGGNTLAAVESRDHAADVLR